MLVDRRPLLVRTVAQVRQWTSDVHIVAGDDHRYKIPGTTFHVASPDEPSEFASTRALWALTGRTVLLLGDVYWTDLAIADVMSCPDQDYRVFGREGPSQITGTPYGEIFATSFWDRQIPDLDRHLETVHQARASGLVTRPPGWMLLRSWCGFRLNRHRVRRPPFVDIDDLTDDIDREDDLRRHPAFAKDGQ